MNPPGPAHVDPDTERYLERVTGILQDRLGDDLVALVTTGSLATGDYHPARSDIDLIAVASGTMEPSSKERLAAVLSHDALPCPAWGLDLVVWPEPEVRPVSSAPRYAFSIATGFDWTDQVSLGGLNPAGVLDLAVARAHGAAILGPDPANLIAEIPRSRIVEQLLAILRWHVDQIHDPFHDPTGSAAVLNACRALRFVKDGALVSKTAGGEWMLEHVRISLVSTALAIRAAGADTRLERDAVRSFLDEAIWKLEAEVEVGSPPPGRNARGTPEGPQGPGASGPDQET